jgi:ketosteroid isomerase-like protein
MPTATDLLKQHLETLVNDPARWSTLVAENLIWELPNGPSIGHPAVLNGKDAAEQHLSWFRGAVKGLRFYDLRMQPMADPEIAVAEVRAEAMIIPTGRRYQQEYVLFLKTQNGKIALLREYFDPVRAARAMGETIAL